MKHSAAGRFEAGGDLLLGSGELGESCALLWIVLSHYALVNGDPGGGAA